MHKKNIKDIDSFDWNFKRFRLVVFNATFNNITVISWLWVLLVEETGVPGENHRPVASHWQTLSLSKEKWITCQRLVIIHCLCPHYWTHSSPICIKLILEMFIYIINDCLFISPWLPNLYKVKGDNYSTRGDNCLVFDIIY